MVLAVAVAGGVVGDGVAAIVGILDGCNMALGVGIVGCVDGLAVDPGPWEGNGVTSVVYGKAADPWMGSSATATPARASSATATATVMVIVRRPRLLGRGTMLS
jgi:hypothetical protein